MAINTSIKAAWNLDEASGNATDATGNGYTLTNNGSTPYAAALINNGANFVPTGDSLNNNSVTGTAVYPRSFQHWFNADTITGDDRCVFALGDGATHYYALKIRDSDDHLVFRSNNNTEAGDVDTGVTVSLSTWYHTVVVQNSSTSVTIYVNNTATNTAAATFVATTSQYYIGYLGRSSVWYFDGRVDIAAIWEKALTAGEVSSLYNAGAGQQYPFTESSTTIKTYNSVVTANVKTVLNGTAIASRKTWNGIS